MGYKHHGVKTGGLPVEYIKRYLEKHPIKVFIETGTAGGDSVREAAKIFEKCYTIEVVEKRNEGDYPENVNLYEGDSAKLLAQIAHPFRNDYVFFWLDAHYSEPHESEPDINECPILEEIKSLSGFSKALIMIDDARLFLGPPKWPCDYTRWPSFSSVFNTLQGCLPKHYITLVDDYIIAMPEEMKDVHRSEWWERQDERFPSEEQKVRNSIKTTYHAAQQFLNSL
jgi:hypothetical protein